MTFRKGEEWRSSLWNSSSGWGYEPVVRMSTWCWQTELIQPNKTQD